MLQEILFPEIYINCMAVQSGTDGFIFTTNLLVIRKYLCDSINAKKPYSKTVQKLFPKQQSISVKQLHSAKTHMQSSS